MAEIKTKPTNESVIKYLESIEDETKKADSYRLVEIMKEVTREEPVMWGPGIVGFGTYHYKYASGREGDWMLTGFSARKQNISVYIMSGFDNLEISPRELGTCKTAKSCLYIKKLSDIDEQKLITLVKESIEILRKVYPQKI